MTYSKSPPSTNHFPWKLHDMLDEAEERDHGHVISWCADGKSFRIHQPNEMVTVLRQYFRQTKYKSLLRQLQGYDFKRVTSGSQKGNVSHPLFQRGRRDLCKDMKRKTNKIVTTNPPYLLSKTRTKPSTKTNKKDSNGTVQLAANGITKKALSTSVPNTCNQKQTQTLRMVSSAPLQPSSVTSSNCVKPVQVSSSDSKIKSPLKQLETNFHCSFQNPLSQEQNKHKATSFMSIPNPIMPKQGSKAAGMDALRVEIGCTFSAPKNKPARAVSIGVKQNAPQRHMQGIAQSSASAPTLENPLLQKRRRNASSAPTVSAYSNPQASFKNASFSFSSTGIVQPSIDKILQQEKMEFQKKQKEMEFAQLEKLCFSNVSRPGMQQFQHTVRSSSNSGTMDLDISLTTTTKTTNEKGDSHMSSSTISNKFMLPSQLEPTPILSPKKANPSNGITLNCDINFPKSEPPKIVLDFPAARISQTPLEGNSSLSQCHLSEVSDEIDEGIAEVFEEDADAIGWKSATFESDIEDDEHDKEEDDWTKGVVYGGKTDCVLEPEKFQMEVQTMFSGSKDKPPQQVVNVLQRLPPQDNSFVQQLQLRSQQNPAMIQQQLAAKQIPNPLRRLSALQQTQRIPMGPTYALLSRPIAFQHTFAS